MNKQQAENLRMAYAIMSGVPATKIRLDLFRTNKVHNGVSDQELVNDCGTSGCVAGFLSAHPYFKKQGLSYRNNSIYLGNNDILGSISHNLFDAWGIFGSGSAGLTGKKQALNRIRTALYGNGRITIDRDKELAKLENELTS